MEFQDTMPLAPAGAAAGAAHGVAPERPREPVQALKIEFTGSGSEYFRIWIVNLLLTIVSFSLYHPFAKARRLRYFHGNTLVGGHALGFHGDPWKMLRGYLLMLAFGACYFGAGRLSPVAGALAGVAFAVLWPALWQSSLRFRLANTSWRGLRMRFGGDLRGAYGALLPLLIPGAFMLAVSVLAQPAPQPSAAMSMLVLLMPLVMLAFLLLLPYTLARLKRYQHGHYQYAGEQTRLDVPTRSFYGLMLRTLLVSALPLLLLGGLAASTLPVPRGSSGGRIAALVLTMAVAYLLLIVLLQSYPAARLQNLVWSGTASMRLQFRSRLAFGALFARVLKNLVFTIVTFGLYRPFAAVALARLRLEAVDVEARGDIDAWTSAAARGVHDASGDAAGDLFGIDLGF